jgi:tetratricopeptide (TPR) repeat protein
MAEGNSFERELQAYTNLMKAVELDPKFVEAYYEMFGLNWGAWAEQLPPRSNRMANFRWAGENIRALRPNSAQYHVVNAGIKWVDWHFADAIAEMKLALKLDPKCRADGLYGLMILRALGDAAGARAEWETAERTTGSDVTTQTQIGTPYYVERKFRRAIEELVKAVNLEPTSYVAHDLLARAYEGDEQYDKALEQMKAAQIASNGESTELERRFNGYRSALVEKGPRGMWQAMLDDARESLFPDHYYLASLHARLSEFDTALDLLEEARKEHDDDMTMLLFDHWWDAMRDYPRFKEVLARVGYPRVSKAK